MAGSGGYRRDEMVPFDIEKAWETLKFKVFDKRTAYLYEATEKIEVCKLQFVLKSKAAHTDFLARLKEKFIFTILSPGIVLVQRESSEVKNIDEFWATLLSSIKQALQFKVVRYVNFTSKQELEETVQEMDDDSHHLLSNGLVGVYILYEENVCIAKCVGSELDSDEFSQNLLSAKKKRESVKKLRESASQRKDNQNVGQDGLMKEPFSTYRTFTSDELNYLKTIRFEDDLREACPCVKLKETENDSNIYEISSSEEKELQDAINLIDWCLYTIQMEEISLSQEDILFLSHENVFAHLQVKLRHVPAYLQISAENAHVWCKERSKLETAKEIVYASYKTTEIEGKTTPESQGILEESHGKIQLLSRTSDQNVKVIRFTADLETEANELVRTLLKYRYRKDKPYSQDQVKAMIALGVIEDLQEGFKDVLIRVYEEQSIVRLQGSAEDRVKACFADLDVIMQRIEFVHTDFLSESAQILLQNSTVRTYVHGILKEKFAFLVDDNGKSYTVCMNKKNKSVTCRSIKDSFVEMRIDRQCLENTNWKHFLEKHSEEIIRKDLENTSYICFTANLTQEVEELLLSYSKDCSDILNDYLQKFGDDCLKKMKEKYLVRVELKNGRICFKGSYDNGKKAMAEIESQVKTEVLQFEEYASNESALSAEKKMELDSIAKNFKCSWNALEFLHDESDSRENGDIEYLSSWKLHEGKGEISVAEIDYKTAKLDGLVIPVNECLYGEDILVEEVEERSYYAEYSNISGSKLVIGDWKPLKPTGKYACTNCIVLVVSDIDIVNKQQSRRYASTTDLQKYFAHVVRYLFGRELYKIGFAISRGNPNFRGKLDAIVAGYQEITQIYDGLPDSKLILGIKGEVESWIQEVDYVLKDTTCTKRRVSPRYFGLLSRPKISTEITEQSILDVGANCIVVAVSPDLDLSRGFVSNLISEASGSQLQNELYSKHTEYLGKGDLLVFDPFDLSEKGIRKLIFGVLPSWSKCKKSTVALETFIQDSLLLADNAGCSTVAFPALGTGNLGYPLRDVSVALFDGIDKYVSEATIGKISTVYIAVPKSADNMSQFLGMEQERRQAQRKSGGKHPQIDDGKFLFAGDENVKYSIVKEDTCKIMSSGKFVTVTFQPGKTTSDVEIRSRPYEIIAKCRDTKEGLKEAVEEIVCVCENEKITSINVFCTKDFTDCSEGDQADIIIDTVCKTVHLLDLKYYASQLYKYLANVRVVTSKAAFSTIHELKIIGKTNSKGFMGTVKSIFNSASIDYTLHWKTDFCQTLTPKTFLNVILAGGVNSDLEKAKRDIKQLLTLKEDGNTDSDKIADEVSAELNPGIVKYLTSLPEADFNNWISCISTAFEVKFMINQNSNMIELSGTFSSILKIEQYLENDFSVLPAKQTGLEFQHEFFKQPEWKFVQLQVTEEESTRICSLCSDEVERLRSNPEVIELDISKDAINIKCKPALQVEIKSKIRKMIDEVKQFPEKKIKLRSKDELSHAMQMNFQKGILCIPDLTTNSIRIIGKEQSLVLKEDENIHSTLLQRQKKVDTIDVLIFQRGIFRFGKLDVTVACTDITDLTVDCIVSVVTGEVNTDLGVAKSFAIKAGKTYLDECKAIFEKIGQLGGTSCVETGPGKLKCKHVLHVYSPLTLQKTLRQEQLSQLTEQVKHCLQKADQLGSRSVAIPLNSTGITGFSMEHHIEELIEALLSFEEAEVLQKIIFVDTKKEKVSDVCCMISKYIKNNESISQSYAEFSVQNLMSDIRYYIAQGQMHSVAADVVVINVDENFCDRGEDLQNLLACSSQQLKNNYAEQRKVLHSCTSVTPIQAGGGGIHSKYVFFAVSPVWKNEPGSYAKHVRIMMQNILEKANELGFSNLALPIFFCEGNPVALAHCCQAMVESVLQFGKEKQTKIKTVQFLSTDKRAISELCYEVVLQSETCEKTSTGGI